LDFFCAADAQMMESSLRSPDKEESLDKERTGEEEYGGPRVYCQRSRPRSLGMTSLLGHCVTRSSLQTQFCFVRHVLYRTPRII